MHYYHIIHLAHDHGLLLSCISIHGVPAVNSSIHLSSYYYYYLIIIMIIIIYHQLINITMTYDMMHTTYHLSHIISAHMDIPMVAICHFIGMTIIITIIIIIIIITRIVASSGSDYILSHLHTRFTPLQLYHFIHCVFVYYTLELIKHHYEYIYYVCIHTSREPAVRRMTDISMMMNQMNDEWYM